jgi:hypothetical protein
MGLGAGLVNLAYQEAVVFLGTLPSNGSDYINAVAWSVSPAELAALDQRYACLLLAWIFSHH